MKCSQFTRIISLLLNLLVNREHETYATAEMYFFFPVMPGFLKTGSALAGECSTACRYYFINFLLQLFFAGKQWDNEPITTLESWVQQAHQFTEPSIIKLN